MTGSINSVRPVDFVREKPVGYLQNGEPVWEKIEGSHLDQHADARPLVAEALGKTEVSDDQGFFLNSADLGRVVGTTSCVATSDTDEVAYMMRVQHTATRKPERGFLSRLGLVKRLRRSLGIPSAPMRITSVRCHFGRHTLYAMMALTLSIATSQQ